MTNRSDRAPCAGPRRLSRREVLQAGAAGMLGLTLPRLLRAGAATGGPVPRRPLHPDLPRRRPQPPRHVGHEAGGARRDSRPVQTHRHHRPRRPAVRALPRLAGHMHRCTLIRSAHHSVNNAHAAAVYCALTGHDRGEIGGGARPDDNPAVGSVVGMRRPPLTPLPPYVSMPFVTKEGAGGPPQPGFYGGLIGRIYDPLLVLRDPNDPAFALPELGLPADVNAGRLDARKRLLDDIADGEHGDAAAREMAGLQARAFDLLNSPTAQKAFQLEHEPDRVRESYGRNIYGQSVLLARRLIEAGTARGLHLLGAGRQRHLGHARQELREAQGDAAAAVRRGPVEPFERLVGSGNAGTDAGRGDGRVRAVAEGQRRGRPRPLEPLLRPAPGRRRRPGRLRPRRQRPHRRPSQPPAGDAGRCHRHRLRMPRRAARSGVAGSVVAAVRAGAVGGADPGSAGIEAVFKPAPMAERGFRSMRSLRSRLVRR